MYYLIYIYIYIYIYIMKQALLIRWTDQSAETQAINAENRNGFMRTTAAW